MKWIVRVNTRTGKIIKQEASQEEMHWGGRLLISKFLLREVPPICDPLGRLNKLIIAPGLLGDTTGDDNRKVFSRGKKPSDPWGEGKRCRRRGRERRSPGSGSRPSCWKKFRINPSQRFCYDQRRMTRSPRHPELKGK